MSDEGKHANNGKPGEKIKAFAEGKELKQRMDQIKHKILILSGKGGVGKSTVAANISVALSQEGKKVGLLDVDFHGPSIPVLLNLEGQHPRADGKSIMPIDSIENIKVMSLGFLLQNSDDAVIWRGPMKSNVIKQLLTDVKWGNLDYLVIDFPPGTGDEPLSTAQLIPDSDGAIIVTTPQNLSLTDVRKSINFCKKINVPVLGVIENMSGLVCPNCKTVIDVFKTGGGETMAKEMGVPFLGRIPIDPLIVEASDSGKPFVHHYPETEAAKAFKKVVKHLLNVDIESEPEMIVPQEENEMKTLKIAIPVVEGHLSAHFGHCEEFAIYDIDVENKKILSQESSPPPPHEPGVLPAWLSERGVNMIIAGGMGSRAQDIFTERGIQVVVGAPVEGPDDIINAYLNGTLAAGENICDH